MAKDKYLDKVLMVYLPNNKDLDFAGLLEREKMEDI